MTPDEIRRLAVRAILWTNGMLMVFDQFGNQLPDYQGIGKEALPLLRRDFPDCPIEDHDWNTEVRPGLSARERE